MKPLIFTYYNNHQRMAFRGYTKTYQGASCTQVLCTEVRGSQAEAMRDAKLLISRLRKNVTVVA